MSPTQDIIYLDNHAGALRGLLLEHDPSVAETTLGKWNLFMRPGIQGKFQLEREILQTESLLVSLDTYRSLVSIVGMTNPSQILLAIPLNHVQGSVCYGSSLTETSLLVGHDKLIDSKMHFGQRLLVVLLEKSLLEAFATEEDFLLLSPEHNEWLFSAHPAILERTASGFIELLKITLGAKQNNQLSGTSVEYLAGQILLDLIIDLRESQQTHYIDSVSRLRVFRRAIEYLSSRPASWRPRIADIASAAATSQRTLEYAFREFAGCTPRTYVREAKLKALRRSLLSDSPPRSVQDAAMALGIYELGRMAGYYRNLFGELPRETIKRNPAR